MADYGKSGGQTSPKDSSRHSDPGKSLDKMKARKGSSKQSAGPRASKDDLVARLKAAKAKPPA
jgi:hypothetical protein